MAELIVEPIQTAELESSGYIGQPEGNIDLTENNVQVNVAPYKYATPKIPIQEDVPAVNPSTQEQTIVPAEGFVGMSSVIVNPANLEEKHITPTTEEQTVVPQSPAIGFSSVTVAAVSPPPVLITKQITENGTYAAEDDNADGYSEVVVEVGGTIEEKAVNFYDYDGTLLYSYTFAEALQLSSLPQSPVHDGYTFQEWNWNLTNIHHMAQKGYTVDVGAIVKPSNGHTRVYMQFNQSEFTSPTFRITGAIRIDYGDGSPIEEYATSATKNIPHTYSFSSFPATVIVDIEPISGNFELNTQMQITPIYKACITAIEYGDNASGSSLSGLYNLERCTIPKGMPTLPTNFSGVALKTLLYPSDINAAYLAVCNPSVALKLISVPYGIDFSSNNLYRNCYQLSRFTLPDTITSITQNLFINCRFESVCIPDSTTAIKLNAFSSCYCIEKIFIPNSVTEIGDLAFSYCYSLMVFDMSAFTDATSIPTLGSNVFQNTYATMIIYVANQEMMTAFSSATNWSTYADRFQIKGA